MYTHKKITRFAGLAYLVLIISGIIGLVYLPSQLIDWNDGTTTVTNLRDNMLMFKLSIVSVVISFLSFFALGFLLHKLLFEVNKLYANVMLTIILVSVTLTFNNLLHHLSIITLIKKPMFLENLGAKAFESEVMMHLENFGNGTQLSYIFWGLWLIPFGLLVIQSKFLPRILGYALLIGGLVYLVDFTGTFFFDNYMGSTLASIMGIPSAFGEFGICLWLLIKGTKQIKTPLEVS